MGYIKKAAPKVVIAENVKGITAKNEKKEPVINHGRKNEQGRWLFWIQDGHLPCSFALPWLVTGSFKEKVITNAKLESIKKFMEAKTLHLRTRRL